MTSTLNERRADQDQRTIVIARAINILALLALIGVLAGSLRLQFAVGEQPCPLCLIQRSGMIGLAVGPAMNLLWGMQARHYALSILAAMVGGAGSIRQILLHIADPADPGYGPAILGYHLYTWAFITFAIGVAGCAILLLWQRQFEVGDTGVMGQRSALRAVAFGAIIWVFVDLVIMTIAVIPECGLGMCPDDPSNIGGIGDTWGLLLTVVIGAGSFVVGVVLDRRLKGTDA